MKKKPRFETVAIKRTENQLFQAEPVSSPIYLSTTFHRQADGSYSDEFIYTRADNPNRRTLESCLAQLEGGTAAFAFSSGMAATSAVFQSLKQGDHVLLPDDVYYQAFQLVPKVFGRWGLSASLVDMTDLEAVNAAIQPNTAMIWLETPSNPQLKVTDIAEIAAIAKKHKILCVVDNTWPTPVLQNPLDLGADIVMHSTTKYFGGHSDVLGGCLVLNDHQELIQKIKDIQLLNGAVPSPFDCWMICRGIQSMALRVKAQSATALELATFLAQHPEIVHVNYPGLPENPQHRVASKQMKNGYGAMLSVLVKGDQAKAMEISNRLRYFTTATSLGGVESLVEHRRSVEGEDSTTPDNLLRLSVGLEHVEDLIDDWKQALKHG